MKSKIYNSDCLEIMKSMPDNSIDAVVTDPPYGLGKEPDIAKLMQAWINGDDMQYSKSGFMNAEWDVVPHPGYWKECFRVLKPGGHLFAFSSTRTWDLMSISIRFAGFQNRDTIASFSGHGVPATTYMFGSGFPKSCNISKKIDERMFDKYLSEHPEITKYLRFLCLWDADIANGMKDAVRRYAGLEREVTGKYEFPDGITRTAVNREHKNVINPRIPGSDKHALISAPASPEAKKFEGYGSALKPSHEVILMFRKPPEGTLADNALKWSTGSLNIDACRITTDESWEGRKTSGIPGISLKGSVNGQLNSQSSGSHSKGRWPANTILTHHPDCRRIGVRTVKAYWGQPTERTSSEGSLQCKRKKHDRNIGYADQHGNETIPEYHCHPDCPVAELDQQSGVSSSGVRKPTENPKYGYNSLNKSKTLSDKIHILNDSGTASRYFKNFSAETEQYHDWIKKTGPMTDYRDVFVLMPLYIKSVTNPANVAFTSYEYNCHPECPVRMLGEQSGTSKNSDRKTGSGNKDFSQCSSYQGSGVVNIRHNDEGTAARYFKNFFYTSKPSAKEKNAGLNQRSQIKVGDQYPLITLTNGVKNTHPTTKPVSIMRYLCKLAAPPGNPVILDPFMGSGTTGIACAELDIDFIGIELDPEFFEIAKLRIEYEQNRPKQINLF